VEQASSLPVVAEKLRELFPRCSPNTAGWKPAPLASAVPASEIGLNSSGLRFLREFRLSTEAVSIKTSAGFTQTPRSNVSNILKFSSVMNIYNGNPYVHMSAGRVAKIKAGWRKPLPVLVRINGKPEKAWRINVMPIGDGNFYLYLHGDVRKASRTKVGDRVQVEVSFDDKYRNGPMHPMPAWFSKPLQKNPKARKAWAALIPSRKKEVLRYFSWLKSPEARQRNLERALRVLSGNEGRFMARNWKDGK
jgi:hypothetical protein